MSDGIFESSTRAAGDMAGVLEYDGKTGYFYLYDLLGTEGQKVIGAIPVTKGGIGIKQADFGISWNDSEEFVGLFIKHNLYAAFDALSRKQFGGDQDHMSHDLPVIPKSILEAF